MRDYISTTVTVREEVDADITLDELAEELDAEQLVYLARKMKTAVVIKHESDPEAERFVERAFLAVRRLSDIPQEIADLFYHVHGRAL